MATIKSLGKIEKTLPKNDIIAIANSDAAEVIESEQFDLLKVYIELKRYEQYLETVIEKIKPLALTQAILANEKNEKPLRMPMQKSMSKTACLMISQTTANG